MANMSVDQLFFVFLIANVIFGVVVLVVGALTGGLEDDEEEEKKS